MSDIKFSPKDIYFLGAGTSSLVGVPTFEYFRNKATEIYKNLPKEDPIIALFERVLNHWNNNFKELNIEHYFTAIEIQENLMQDLNEQENRESEEIKSIDIIKFISYTIEKSSNNNLPRNKYFSEFLSDIFSNHRISRSAIITTNWDIVLEKSSILSLQNKWIKYEGKDIQPYHETEVEKIEREVQLRILKLHGSINWGYCKKCEKIYYFDKEISKEISVGIKCPNKECLEKLALELVPPICSKLDRRKSLCNIWKTAQDYLKSCEKIYFIGYSFPETDLQMKIFISNALKKNLHLEDVIIVSNEKYAASKIDFEERYLSILPTNSKIRFYYDGFEKVHDKLPEYPPSMGNIDEW
jgi:NAD-dependent SIR2 family protein deacetylase